MARSCGIRIGPRRYELVVVDGSPKKHKISAATVAAIREGKLTTKDLYVGPEPD